MSDSRHERNFVKTLARGLRVIRAFQPERPELTLSELAEILELDAGTVTRFVYTLEYLNYLKRDPNTRAYRLTTEVLNLGRAVHQQEELISAARPFMEELSRATRETVALAVRDGLDIVVLEEVLSRQSVMARDWVGNRYPCYCTAQGKVLLAFLPDGEREQLLEWTELRPFNGNTITDHAVLVEELNNIAKAGYAVANDEMDAGMFAIAGPVFSGAADAVAALSLGVPSNRMSLEDVVAQFREAVQTTSEQISRSLAESAAAN